MVIGSKWPPNWESPCQLGKRGGMGAGFCLKRHYRNNPLKANISKGCNYIWAEVCWLPVLAGFGPGYHPGYQ